MALMTYREANQVLRRGVRPAHDGTQITKAGVQNGAGNNPLYAGHATKTLFISYMMLSSRESAAAAGNAYITCQPLEEGALRTILAHFYDIAGHQSNTATFNPPLEVEPNTPVTLLVDHANIDARGCFHGWLE